MLSDMCTFDLPSSTPFLVDLVDSFTGANSGQSVAIELLPVNFNDDDSLVSSPASIGSDHGAVFAVPSPSSAQDVLGAESDKGSSQEQQVKPMVPTGTDNDERVCNNCLTTQTPLWRRDEAGNLLCNACRLYQKTYSKPRPVHEQRLSVKKKPVYPRCQMQCKNCLTKETSLWRRLTGPTGLQETYCNACGLYQKIHNVPRPIKPGSKQPLRRRSRGWKRSLANSGDKPEQQAMPKTILNKQGNGEQGPVSAQLTSPLPENGLANTAITSTMTTGEDITAVKQLQQWLVDNQLAASWATTASLLQSVRACELWQAQLAAWNMAAGQSLQQVSAMPCFGLNPYTPILVPVPGILPFQMPLGLASAVNCTMGGPSLLSQVTGFDGMEKFGCLSTLQVLQQSEAGAK